MLCELLRAPINGRDVHPAPYPDKLRIIYQAEYRMSLILLSFPYFPPDRYSRVPAFLIPELLADEIGGA